MSQLTQILDQFQNRINYLQIDKKSLDFSRRLHRGDVSDGDFKEWAAINDDPTVIVNTIKTNITVLCSQLSSNPFVPVDDGLRDIGEYLKLDSVAAEQFQNVLNDGFAYVGIGMANGRPVIKQIDARHILFNGEEPTLKDATDVIVFEVRPKDINKQFTITEFPMGYVDFDANTEYVICSHYHKVDGGWALDVYEDCNAKPITYPIMGIDRCPVVRFVGEKYELSDKRWHYRGLYYTMGSLLKAMVLTATKLQTRVATQEDANWILNSEAVAADSDFNTWSGAGARTIKDKDANGMDIRTPFQQVQHDNQLLVNAFNLWNDCITNMLGPVTVSGSDAATREEVIARNQVRDSIVNSFMIPTYKAVCEIYRIINMMMNGDSSPVLISGGFLDAAKKSKAKAELDYLYNKAKESGMNTQPIVQLMVKNSDLEKQSKEIMLQGVMQDINQNPVVVKLNQQLKQLQQTTQQQIQSLTFQNMLLKAQSSIRREHQSTYIAQQKEQANNEIQFKQWKEEHQDVRDASMELLKTLLNNGDMAGAFQVIQMLKQEDHPVLLDQSTQVVNQGESEDIHREANAEYAMQMDAAQLGQGVAPVNNQAVQNTVASNQNVQQQTNPILRPENTVAFNPNRGGI